jgi:glycosyl hydrolase family 2
MAWPTLALGLLLAPAWAPETEIRYLSGRGKDDALPWEFFCTAGRRSGQWTTIPVPSSWEQHGFGTYNYGHDAEKSTEEGRYRLRFEAPAAWRGRKVALVFEGAMTDTEVRVNGRPAGAVHQGGFVRFRSDVGRLLNLGGSNLLEVTVRKTSADESVNFAERSADYWIFGGIFRPVYLEIAPAESIARTAIDARADGSFRVDVHLDGIATANTIEARIETLEGTAVSGPVRARVEKGQSDASLSTTLANPRLWSAETPNLYRAVVTLKRGDAIVHRAAERFGFRTVEVRAGDGVYVNGNRIRLKGMNRHSFWPDSGRTTSAAVSRDDVDLMKAMNVNAVRSSHYPPDTHFLEACDERGLYVIDELPGWQSPYDTAVGATLVREMVRRDVNHPSVIFWSSGNEGGHNPELDDDFGGHDPQARPLLNPYATLSHVFAQHYPDYAALQKALSGDTVYMPTEFLHGLYDGGGGAGLDDYWTLMTKSRVSAGGFLWSFADEAVRRTDRDGALDTDGNHAPDGVLGPYREKEGSFFAIRDIWSPIQLPLKALPDTFDGRIPIENGYDFTNVDRCRFRFQLLRFHGPGGTGGHEVVHEAAVVAPSVAPGDSGALRLELPPSWRGSDALLLTATGPDGREVNTWTWAIRKPAEILKDLVSRTAARARPGERRVTAREDGGRIVLSARGIDVAISKSKGTLVGVRSGGRPISFGEGPVLVGKNVSGWLEGLDHGADGDAYVVRARFGGNLKEVTWRLESSGWLRLAYRFRLRDRDGHADHDYYGVTFRYPESQVTGIQWLGRGPHRVWKNRMRGPTLEVWTKDWNATETGRSWNYPEFKGYYANLHWAVLRTREQDFVVATETEDLFLRLYTPSFADALDASAAFPPGDVSFLHGIAPIGMKFLEAGRLGPQGGRHLAHGDFAGTLLFFFGDVDALGASR